MLDEQFFNDKKFHPYLDKNFVSVYAYKKHPLHGRDIYKELGDKYALRYTPTVLIANPAGEEIDRIVGFRGEPDVYKENLEKLLKSDNTMFKLVQAYKKKPENIVNVVKLAKKYQDNSNNEKAGELYKEVIAKPDAAKKIKVPFGKDGADISAFDFAEQQLKVINSRRR